jgi:hypothetical protein
LPVDIVVVNYSSESDEQTALVPPKLAFSHLRNTHMTLGPVYGPTDLDYVRFCSIPHKLLSVVDEMSMAMVANSI